MFTISILFLPVRTIFTIFDLFVPFWAILKSATHFHHFYECNPSLLFSTIFTSASNFVRDMFTTQCNFLMRALYHFESFSLVRSIFTILGHFYELRPIFTILCYLYECDPFNFEPFFLVGPFLVQSALLGWFGGLASLKHYGNKAQTLMFE